MDKEIEEYVDYVVKKLLEGRYFSHNSVKLFAFDHNISYSELVENIKKRLEGKELEGAAPEALRRMEISVIENDLKNIPEYAGLSNYTLYKYAKLIYEGKPLLGKSSQTKSKIIGMSPKEYSEYLARRKGFTGESGRSPETEYREHLAKQKGFTGETGKKPLTEYREALARKKGFESDYYLKQYIRMSKVADFARRLIIIGYSLEQAKEIVEEEIFSKHHIRYLSGKRKMEAFEIAEKSVELEKNGLLLPMPKD